MKRITLHFSYIFIFLYLYFHLMTFGKRHLCCTISPFKIDMSDAFKRTGLKCPNSNLKAVFFLLFCQLSWRNPALISNWAVLVPGTSKLPFSVSSILTIAGLSPEWSVQNGQLWASHVWQIHNIAEKAGGLLKFWNQLWSARSGERIQSLSEKYVILSS